MQLFIETLAAQLTLGADPVRGSLNQVGLLQTSDRLRLVSTRLREASSIGVTVVKESNDLAPAPEKRPQRKRRPKKRPTPSQNDLVVGKLQADTEGTKPDLRRPKVIIGNEKKAKILAVGATKPTNLMPYRMVFYTDGSTHTKEAIHGAGITYKCFPAEPKDMLWHDESYGVFGTHIIDTAEMLAITCALKIALREASRYSQRRRKGVYGFGVFIFTDSQTSLSSIRDYLSSDKRPSVREAFLCKQSSAEIPGLLDSLYEAKAKVEFHWVPGHSGVIGNTRADRLAKDAVEAARSIMTRHLVPPHGKDFEIISVKDMVAERIEMEKDQKRDQMEGAVASLLHQGKSPADILALMDQIKMLLERTALNHSPQNQTLEPLPETSSDTSTRTTSEESVVAEQAVPNQSSQHQIPESLPETCSNTVVETTSRESVVMEYAPKLELVEPCSTESPRRSRGKQIVVSLKKPFRRVSRGLRKWRKIEDGE